MKKIIFEKFRKDNFKYCKIFGIKLRYAKVPYSERALDKIIETQSHLSNLESSVARMQDAIVSNAAAQNAETQNQISNLESSVARMQDAIVSNTAAQNAETQNQISNLESSVARMQDAIVSNAAAQNAETQNQISNLESSVARMQDAIVSNAAAQNAETQNRISSLENTVLQLQNTIASNNAAQIATIQDFIVTHTKQITDMISGYNLGAISDVKNYVTAIKAQTDYIQRIFPIYLLAQAEHKKVFPKYKNCHKGQSMVLLASGPTLDDYTPQQDCLFMGVNKSFMADKANLDYLFVQDLMPNPKDQEKIDSYRGNNCKKFYGVHYCVPGISWSHSDNANAERYYFIDCNMLSAWPFPVDCSTMPFNTYSSVVFPAAVFALWSGVKKLYIVGCDTSLNGYFGNNGPNGLCVDNVIYGWRRFKEFAQTWYPDTEIISVNPVGLKGLFKDVYTESYLKKHPEIAATHPEILK